MPDKLKPCPFCNCDANYSSVIDNEAKRTVLSIDCGGCWAEMSEYVYIDDTRSITETKEALYRHWNNRFQET